MITVNGNNNIIITDVHGSIITINYNDIKKIEDFITQLTSDLKKESDLSIKKQIEIAIDTLQNIFKQHKFQDRLTTIPILLKEDILGREVELIEVDELLNRNERVVLVNGLGGIGKTTLAKAYINENVQRYKHTAWLEVDKNIKESFVFNRELVDSLGLMHELEQISSSENHIEIAFDLIVNRMRALKGNNLLILDNAQEDIEDLDILDKISLKPYWKVIVTSRNNLEGFANYELSILKPEPAQKLFYKFYTYQKNDKLVGEILRLINYHTLTIEVYAKTAEAKLFKLDEILELIKKKITNISPYTEGVKTKRNKNKPINSYIEYLINIFPYNDFSDYDRWILYNLSVLPSRTISYRDHTNGLNLTDMLNVSDENRYSSFPESLRKLERFGWLKKINNGFVIHNLLQEVVQHVEGDSIERCESLVDYLSRKLESFEYTNRFASLEYIPYASSIFEIFVQTNNLTLGVLLNNIGHVYEEIIGDYRKALDLSLTSLAIKEFFNYKPGLGSQYNNLANTYRCLGKYDIALDYARKSLKVKIEVFGENNELVGNSYQTLSIIYRRLGKFEEASEACLKAIEIRQINSEHPEADKKLSRLYNNISIIFRSMEEYDKALEYSMKSLHIKDQYFSDDLQSLSISYNSISVIYRQTFRYKEALIYAEKDLNILEQIYENKNHPDYIPTYNNLGSIYCEMDQLDQAKYYSDKEIEVLKANFDDDHPEFVEALKLQNKINGKSENL